MTLHILVVSFQSIQDPQDDTVAWKMQSFFRYLRETHADRLFVLLECDESLQPSQRFSRQILAENTVHLLHGKKTYMPPKLIKLSGGSVRGNPLETSSDHGFQSSPDPSILTSALEDSHASVQWHFAFTLVDVGRKYLEVFAMKLGGEVVRFE